MMTKTKQLLTTAEVVSMIAAATGLTFVHKKILNMAKAGTFPEPSVRLNAKSIYWSAPDVADWLRDNFASVP